MSARTLTKLEIIYHDPPPPTHTHMKNATKPFDEVLPLYYLLLENAWLRYETAEDSAFLRILHFFFT